MEFCAEYNMRSGNFRLQFSVEIGTQFDAAISVEEFALFSDLIVAPLAKLWREQISNGILCRIEHEVGQLPVAVFGRDRNAVRCRYFTRRVCTPFAVSLCSFIPCVSKSTSGSIIPRES